MKNGIRTLLFLGLAAALPAQAVYVNQNGSGEVLLFPYYTVNAGQSTVLRIANTTNRAKLFSINFREGYNSREVLLFHVALGPQDTWSGTLGSLGEKSPANLHTVDPSCTSPDKPQWNPAPGGGWNIDMFRWAYIDDNADGGPTTAARSREGHIEVIELAELRGALAAAVTSGPTRNCQAVSNIDPFSPDLAPPAGGLSAQFAIVDTAQGTYMAGKATALADFTNNVLLNDFGTGASLQLAQSAPGEAHADFLQDGGSAHLRYSTAQSNTAVDAVSTVLAADSLSGDITAAAGGFTEWVVTLPTKYHYTDNLVLGLPLGSPGAVAPFEQVFSEVHNGASCSRFEATGFTDEGNVVNFNPAATVLPAKSLCRAVNVLSFGPLAANVSTPVLRSRLGSSLWNPQPPFDNGRVKLSFVQNNANQARLLRPSLDNVAVRGMPLIGFAAYKYTTANALPGQLAETVLHPLGTSSIACMAPGQSIAVRCP